MWPGNPLPLLRKPDQHRQIRRKILRKVQFFWASESKYWPNSDKEQRRRRRRRATRSPEKNNPVFYY
jgi:hypothetical protein